ncbi:hypothetical protein QZH41_014730, partial [Actinostola sp. cb2023]
DEQQEQKEALFDNNMDGENGRKGRTHEFDDIFLHLKSFGRYQMSVFFPLHLLIVPIAMQFDALVFAFSTPGFHCVTANVTCPAKKCCEDCTTYVFDGPFHSTVSELSAGVASSFVDCISFLAFLRFLVGLGIPGMVLPHFIFVMEFVGPSYRTAAGNFNIFVHSFVGLWTTFCAYFIPNWRMFLLACTLPAVLLFPFWRVMPESPRWLIAHNRLDEAHAVLMKYGGKDNKPVDPEMLRVLIENVRRDQLATEEEEKKYSPLDLVRTPKMRKWIIIMCYQWFVVAMVSFGILLFVTQLAGSPYINFLIMNSAASIKVILTYVVYLKFGRRISHAGFLLITGVVLLLILAVHEDFPLATTAMSLIGYITIDSNWIGIYVITSELFPTVLRYVGWVALFEMNGTFLVNYLVVTR